MSQATTRSEWLKKLSPAKRALLLKSLREEATREQNANAIPHRPHDGHAPLSFAQRRLWFIEQLQPGSPLYNVPEAIRLSGTLNVEALEQSFNEVVRRHEALRTTFTFVDGQPVQVIAPTRMAPLLLVDLRHLPEAEREARARHLVKEEARRPFDLSADLLLRIILLWLDDREHVLLLTMHHVIADGWSMGVLVREATALYRAFSRGGPSPLPELSIQYADFARWQQEKLQGEFLDTQLAYWKQQLAGAPVLQLPADRPRPGPGELNTTGARQPFALPKELTDALRALSEREGVTLFMTLLAAFKVLLQRYSNQDQVVVGAPIANRHRGETEDLIGFFANVLVLHTDLSGGPTFRELLARVREVALAAYEHQDLPFEKLVEELQPERDLSRNPVFQVAFVFQNGLVPAMELPGLLLRPLDAYSGTSKFDLLLDLRETPAGLAGFIEYSLALFEPDTIARLKDNFRTLLEGVVEGADRPVTLLPILSEAERRRLLQERQAARPRFREERCLHELIERQAAATPDAVALVFEGEGLTYGQLNRQANRLAHHLRRLGAGPEATVGVLFERSVEMVVALLAVLKSGGAYLPLDNNYPAERLSAMLTDAGVRLVLAAGKAAAALPEGVAQLVRLDADREEIERCVAENPPRLAIPDNLAYVIYTSGSTGQPKGAMNTHRAVCNRLLWMQEQYGLHPSDAVLQKTPFTFDVSVWEFFWPLLTGARLVVARPGGHRDPSYLVQLIRQERVTTLHFVPSMLQAFLGEPEAGGCADVLRRVVCSGEALSWGLQQHFFGSMPGVELHNLYGPTEAAVDVTYWRCVGGDESGIVPIGRPVANTQIHVLDGQMNPVPVRVSGELYIGGVQVGRGYLRRPALTAEKFIPDPFSAEPGARLYRTGDVVRRLPGGEIEYLGRIDHQVKIRGFRIELGEIESVLGGLPGVAECAVLARDDGGDKQLVAYVVPNPTYGVSDGGHAGAEQVSQWEMVFDETYSQAPAQSDPTFNITGWNNSYTGLPIAEEEMREWVDRTVERILSQRPNRVLEIGCGAGLLLFRLASRCVKYFGTDVSQVALDYIQKTLAAQEKELPQLTLLNRAAHDFAGLEAEEFDAVILNSIVQYFPNIDYLVKVLKGAVGAIKSGGFIFVGDVRSLPLLEAFHLSVMLHRSPPALPLEQLQQRVRKHMAQEEELVIDPAFFVALKRHLPRISQAHVLLKRGLYRNELTRFRYDVLLRVEGEPEPELSPAAPRLDWQEKGLTLAKLHQLLVETEPDGLSIAHVPNARVQPEVGLLGLMVGEGRPATAGDLRQVAPNLDGGVDPEDIWSLSRYLPYEINICCPGSGAPDCFDVAFKRRTEANQPAAAPACLAERPVQLRPWANYANNPLQGKFTRKLTPELRQMLQKRLPDYMVPSVFMLLDSLPLTHNGKVNRRALPAPEESRPELERLFVPPRTPVEEMLADTFSHILGVKPVGIHDNFFELGGHSLLATQLLSRVRDSFQLKELSLRSLFESPTVAGMAEQVEAARLSGQGPAALPILPVSRDRGLVLSFAQQRLWFLDQLEPGSPAYNVPAAIRATGLLNAAALEQSFDEVIRRHEALRTHFANVGGRDVQVVSPPAPRGLPLTDLRHLPPDERGTQAALLVRAAARRSFDLSKSPLLRLRLLRLDDREHLLVIVMHHAVSDGWSLGVLVREVAALYESFSGGGASPLAELPIQYADFAYWQRQWLQLEAFDTQLAYWKRQLSTAPAVLDLPADLPRPPVRSGRGARRTFSLPRGLTEELKSLSQREGVTLFMTLLAGFQTLLYRYTGEPDVVVGSDIANRNRVETEGLIGFFSNMIVLRADLSGDPTFRELLARVRETTLGAYAHQDLPFEKLVEEMQPRRDLSHTPLFQVVFTLQNAPLPPLQLPGLTLSLLEVDQGTAKFDLVLNMWDQEQGLTGALEYNTDLFLAPTAASMLGRFERLLGRVAARPEARLSELDLLSEEESALLEEAISIGEFDEGFSFQPKCF